MTVAAEVWIRPWDSVTGTRCTRWVPPSCFRRRQASAPFTMKVTSFRPSRSEGSDGEDLELPPVPLGVAPVHLEEVVGEEVRLLATFGAPDLDDDVASVVGVLGANSRR